jgi:glycosyltransferase involved in cell wall biosynthesis
METRKKTVLLFYQQYSTFVREDDKILSENFRVIKHKFSPSKKPAKFIKAILKSFLFSVIQIPKCDIVYIWFADYHSFFPVLTGKIFNKKIVIVVGGYDAVYIPSIDFGIFGKRNFRSFAARYSLKNADMIFPVDESLVESLNKYADTKGNGFPVGIKHFVPGISGKIEVIPTGYDSQKWARSAKIEQNPSVVTIGGANDMQTYKRKGLDFFINIARLMPETEFHIIGLHGKLEQLAKSTAPENIVFHGYVNYDDLPSKLSAHKVFAQFSISEGLPNTLCEAMLCECIPVGSAANGIPKGIGNTGFILEKMDTSLGAKLVQQALHSEMNLGKQARERVKKLFPIQKRKEKIIDLLLD